MLDIFLNGNMLSKEKQHRIDSSDGCYSAVQAILLPF